MNDEIWKNIDGILQKNIENRKKVVAIKNNRIVYKANSSKKMAKIIKEKEHLNTSIETLARNIRRFANQQSSIYHGYRFEFV